MRRLLLLKKVVLACAMTLFSLSVFAQAHSVSGVVTDETNQTVPGVAVMIKGTSTGTVTDMDGRYTIQAADGDVLQFSFLGYTTQEVTVSGATANANLEPDAISLNEVVAIGYGVQRKSDLTGSVASVGENDLKNRSTPDAAAALQGKAAGVQVLTNSGAPGSGASIRVRGMSSNSGNLGPLLIVDGLKVDNIQYLDPEMIESMEVLKDAASAAIYGAQAGNGVVLVTTKNGKKAKDGTIFYNGQWQLSSLSRKLDVMNAEQYIDYGKKQGFLSDERLAASGYVPGTDIDWADEVFEPTWNSRHTVGVQGAGQKGNYFVAINYVKNNGIFKGDKDEYKRLSLQANGDYKVKKWLSVGVNNAIEKWSTKNVSQQNDNGSALLAAVTSDPLFGPYCETAEELNDKQREALLSGVTVLKGKNGKYYKLSPISGESQSANPFIQRDNTEGTNEGINIRGVAYLNFNPIDGLVYTSRFGYRIAQSNSHTYETPYAANAFVHREVYNISAGASNSYYYQWENFVNFDKTFADLHTVGAMAGMSWEANHSDGVNASANGNADPLKGYQENFRYLNYVKSDADVAKQIGNAPGDSKNMSYIGRLTYSFDNRYSVQGNFRADAFDSSKLPADKRWGKFYSFSGGWTLSNESFIKDNIDASILSFLKIRGSWGINGNINVLGGYPYSAVLNLNEDFYQYTADGKPTYTSVPNGLPNPNLKWEQSEQLDLGLDARLLDSRLSLGIDWYKKTTKDWLVHVKPVLETGIGDQVINAGEIENTGIEVELGWKDEIIDGFHYSINANMATLKNEVTFLDPTVDHLNGTGLQGSDITTRCAVGHTIWYFYGYKTDGLKDDGTANFVDVNGDGVWDSNDMTDLGSGLPKVTYGLTINLDYKGVDLTIFGNGVAGNKILPQAYRVDRPYCNNYAWYYENSGSKFPTIENGGWSKDAYSSDLTIFKGDYFKIKQIQLGYNLPKDILSKAFINSMRVFASLENFITITKYIGLDPETASANSSNSQGIDMGTYPTAKQVIFGVNVTF